MLFAHHLKNRTPFIGAFALLVLVGGAFFVSENKGPVTPQEEELDPYPYEAMFDFSLVQDKPELDRLVTDYYLAEEYDDSDRTCGTLLEGDYGIEYTGDFVTEIGADEYILWLGAYCGGPVRGGGGNGPYLVVSRTEAGYTIIGEPYGDGPIIEESEQDDEAGVPDILVIQDDAPPGNYYAQEWIWDAQTSYYIEHMLSREEEVTLLKNYLGEEYKPKDSRMQL